jgi:hypothetical protein
VPDGPQGGKFNYDGDRPSRWADTDDIWVHGYWTWEWADSVEKVERIDTETREITTREPHGVYGYKEDRRYYFINVLEELDAPGEWYLDRKTGILYFWPPEPIQNGEVILSLLEDPIVEMEDASFITIRDFRMECTRGTAIEVTGGRGNLIAGCTIRNTGNAAVGIEAGTKHRVLSCEISETGGCGIIVNGGDRKTLTPAGHVVENCHIYRFSRRAKTCQPAIMIQGVGNRIAHNLLHDAPHSAIMLNGNDHIIEFNEIHSVCKETGDAGAFYMGRDWTHRGNVIRFNYFHNIRRTEGLTGYSEVMAVYLDDWSSGTRIYGNIFYKAGRAAKIGGGRDNVVQNNIFVDCLPAVHVDARGLGWAKNYFDGTVTTMFDRMEAMNATEPPYSVRYPPLATILDDEPAVPKGNSITRNIFHGGRWIDILDADKFDRSVLDVRDNLLEGDPGFVNRADADFRLREDSPAWALGFKRIPVERIGLYQDEYMNR